MYSVAVKASIPQVLEPSKTKEISFSFVVTIVSDCLISVIDDFVLNDMNTVVLTPVTQVLTLTNTRATLQNDATHCGNYLLELSPVHPFLTIAGTTMTLSTNLVSETGTYPLTLKVSLPDFP